VPLLACLCGRSHGRAPRLRTMELEQRAVRPGRLSRRDAPLAAFVVYIERIACAGLSCELLWRTGTAQACAPGSTRHSDEHRTVHACVTAWRAAGTMARPCCAPGHAGAPQRPAGRRGAACAYFAAPAALGRRRGGLQVMFRPAAGARPGRLWASSYRQSGAQRPLARVGPLKACRGLLSRWPQEQRVA